MKEKSISSDLAKLDATEDKDIDYSDSPALDDAFFSKPLADWQPGKEQLTVRLDKDVLAWLRSYGKGYQTRINHILRTAMDAQSNRDNR